MMRPPLFVTATGTDVGKTWVCGALLHAWPEARYWKPCQTGPARDHDGPALVRDWALSSRRVHDVGYRFDLPASPHHAAHVQGARCDLATIVRWGRELPPCERWVVEGAGGALVPLNEAELVVDIPSQMGWPVLLVASTKLGGINETLLSVEALRRRSIWLLGVVSVGRPCASYASAMGFHAPEVPVHHVETFDRPFHFTADRPAHALASWLEAQEVRR